MPDGYQVRIEFIDKRDACRDIEFGDILVRNIIEILDRRTNAVAMR